MKTEDRTVAVGAWAAKLLVTDVINNLLPPISCELTDEVALLAEPNPDPWTGRRIADIEGRLDDAPQGRVILVNEIERAASTGKLRPFVPLATTA